MKVWLALKRAVLGVLATAGRSSLLVCNTHYWASIVVETTKWLRVVPDIKHEIVLVDDLVIREVQVPHHVLHSDLRRPAEQQPHRFLEWKVTLEERVEPNVWPLPSK